MPSCGSYQKRYGLNLFYIFMIFLSSIYKKPKDVDGQFPFTLPIFQNFDSIHFKSPVVFFVGENGSGKSTLIEAIAYGMNAVAVGSENLETDDSLQHIRSFSSYLRFVKNRRHRRGFFFRAEDFFGFIKRVKTEVKEFKELESEYEGRFTGYGKLLATGMANNQHSALRSRYGDDEDNSTFPGVEVARQAVTKRRFFQLLRSSKK